MSGVSLKYNGCDANVCIELGRLRFINSHVGGDHVNYFEMSFDRGHLYMPAGELTDIARQAQEALVAASAVAQRNTRRT